MNRLLYITCIFLGMFVLPLCLDLADKANGDSLNDKNLSVLNNTLNKKILDKDQSISVGNGPNAITIFYSHDKNKELAYVANMIDDTVNVIDVDNNEKIAEIQVGNGPRGIVSVDELKKVYVANSNDDTVSVIDATNNTVIKNIDVGEDPRGIASDDKTKYEDKVYVANSESGTISVIDATTDTVIKNITVGGKPRGIDIDEVRPIVYVTFLHNGTLTMINETNYMIIKNVKIGEETEPYDVTVYGDFAYISNDNNLNDSVSVINVTNDRIIKNITVGEGPRGIAINKLYHKVYVANSKDDTVSVIDATNATNNTVIKNIDVGDEPLDIAIDQNTESVYTTNRNSNSITLIDPKTDEKVIGFTVSVNPSDRGYIECNGIRTPTFTYLYVNSIAECEAIPTKGYEFVSWQENFVGNSSRLITNNPEAQFWDPLLNLIGYHPNKPEAIVNISNFGSFTANFKPLPPPLPAEYVPTLVTFVLSTIIGAYFIPSFIGWIRSKNNTRTLNQYYKRILLLYQDNQLDKYDIDNLNQLKADITDAYSKGKLGESPYLNLKNDISNLYEEIFNNQIKLLSPPDKHVTTILIQLKADITDAYSKGKLNEMHYNGLKRKISIIHEEIFKKDLELLQIEDKDFDKKIMAISKQIADTYSKDDLTELHYNLLSKMIQAIEGTGQKEQK